MAPVISKLTRAEEEALMNAVQRQWPALKVDMLSRSAAVKEGENFMSDVSKVDVAGHDLLTGKSVDISLIMKSLPQSTERCTTFHCDAASKNEAIFYSLVLPPLLSEVKLSFPGCLLATNELLVLRHLGQDGFIMADRKKGLDLIHCQLVLKELARFHATSLAFKHKNPEEFFKIPPHVNEIFIDKDNIIFNPCVDNTIDLVLKAVTDVNSPAVKLLKGIYGSGFKVLSPLITPKEPLSVICHGDLWSNNLLFRYSDENPKAPSDVCFLDLQGWRYASPSLDILYFLFTSGGVGVVRQHFRDLIATYQHALADQLKKLAPCAPEVSLDDIMEDIRCHAVFGLMMSLLTLPVVTAEDFIVNLDGITEEMMMSQEFQNEASKGLVSEGFIRRVNENLQIFCDEGLI